MTTTSTRSSDTPRVFDGLWPIPWQVGYLLLAIVIWLNGIAIGRLVR